MDGWTDGWILLLNTYVSQSDSQTAEPLIISKNHRWSSKDRWFSTQDRDLWLVSLICKFKELGLMVSKMHSC